MVYLQLQVHTYRSPRNKDQKLGGCLLKIGYLQANITLCFIENVCKIWPIKMDFGRPNAEIGWKMANSRLLFLDGNLL